MELRMYRYRIYPSKKQIERLLKTFKICKEIYNFLLEQSINTYKEKGKILRRFDYNKMLSGKYPELHAQNVQNVSDRVHKSFFNFFSRIKDKTCKKKGFPRFKSQVQSITFPQPRPKGGFKFLSNKLLKVSKIGSIPIILHRIPKGKIKTLTIKQNKIGQWFAIFSCEIDIPIVEHTNKDTIGIDVGIESLAVLSNGQVIDNPRFLIHSEKRLKLLHRQVSRKKKGSVNRRKARRRLSKLYIKITNQRDDFIHKLSRTLVVKHKIIKVEDLNIKNMLKNHCLAKHISDASWNRLFQFLSYKAVTCGGQVIKVNPRNTSKTCSNCGTIIDMPLKKKKFLCSKCGFSCHRDLNASINIQGRVGLTQTNTPVDDCVRPSLGKAMVNEAGTIFGK